MSDADALAFLRLARADAALRDRLRAGRHALGLDDLVAAGAERGLTFDAAALARAYRADWTMRAAFLNRRSEAPPS